MKGVDTNILVRYIVQDDPQQSTLATQFLENECLNDNLIVITGVVLCELVWVLESAYNYSKDLIVKVIEQILKTKQFYLHEADILWQSISGYSYDGADFADHYIMNLNHKLGCEFTTTFDKKASRLRYYKLLK